MKKSASLISRTIGILLVAFATALVLGACQNLTIDSGDALELPVVSPSGGRFADASVLVSMSSPTEGAMVFYTDDGTTPTSSSNRYLEPFRIFGTEIRIKAIAVKGGVSSSVATATFVLNDGRSADQLGVVRGTINLGSESANIPLSSINIFSDQIPGVVKKPDATGAFVFDGLDTTQAYTFYFTNQEVGPVRGSRLIRPITPETHGRPLAPPGNLTIIARQIAQVIATRTPGLNLGEILLKKTGKVAGIARMHGRTGELATDHTGIDVYVPGTSFYGKTDASGAFALWFVPEGTYRIRAEKAGYTFKEATGLTVIADQETNITADPLDIYYGYGTVSGNVVLRDGSAGAAAYGGVQVLLRNLSDALVTYTITTGPDGSYSRSDIEPGSYAAFVTKEGFVPAQTEGIAVTAAAVTTVPTVTLTAYAGKVSGRASLKDASDHAGIIIVARDDASSKTFPTATASDGSYTLDPILPGTYRIIASRAGYATRTLSGVVVSSGLLLSNMDFPELAPAAGTITGTVRLAGAASFEGIAVTARKSDDPTTNLSAITDASGIYVFSDVKPGTYLIRFSKEGYLSGEGVQATISDDGIVAAPEALLGSSKARIAGTATLSGSSDHAGIAILASGLGGGTASALTDAVGRFVLVGLDPDTYTIQATKDGYTNARSDPITVGAGQALEGANLSLAVSTRAAIGKILLEGMSVYSGTKVTATNIADLQRIYSALTNDEGYFVVAGMVPGSYILSFSRENFKGITTNAISLESTSTVTLPDATLERARGGIQGIVRLEGRTNHEGTRVQLVGTAYETTTAADGSYQFQVPSGNYPGGVHFDKVDFQTTMDTDTITVLTDSTFGVHTATLAATHNTVTGTIDLLGNADDSGIAVTIDGMPEFTTATGLGGVWSLEHVPLGSYTLRFWLLNTPEVTCSLSVIPADTVVVPKLDMIPNASSLKGYVKLSGMTDHAGITVSVSTDGKPDQTATTNSSGYFYIGNILSTGSHVVRFSKNGWTEQSLTISDFSPLEVRTIGVSPEIALLDETAPAFTAINGVLLNEGANFTSDKNIRITLNLVERGSGVYQMQVQLNGFPSEPNWEPYTPSMTKALDSIFPAAFIGNGEYQISVRVMDKADNISAWANDSVTMTDQQKVVKGVLSGDDLHWTKAKSPYRVEGNMLVEQGQTLTIDPGVEVFFSGAYYLLIEGDLQAVGSDQEKILFASVPGLGNTWKGIQIANTSTALAVDGSCHYQSGPRIVNAIFRDASFAVDSYSDFYIEKCEITASCGNSYILGREIKLYIVNCLLQSPMPTEWHIPGTSWRGLEPVVVMVNSIVDYSGGIWFDSRINADNTEFKVHGGGIGFDVWDAYDSVFTNCVFYELGNSISLPNHPDLGFNASFRYNNIIGYGALAVSTSQARNKTSVIDFTSNYWGSAWTQELDLLGEGKEISFIYDYYDDFSLSRILYSNWAPSFWPMAGYRGDAFVSFSIAATKESVTTASVSITPWTQLSLSKVRYAQAANDLEGLTWSDYSTIAQVHFDPALAIDGLVELFAQAMDIDGNISGIYSCSFAP